MLVYWKNSVLYEKISIVLLHIDNIYPIIMTNNSLFSKCSIGNAYDTCIVVPANISAAHKSHMANSILFKF